MELHLELLFEIALLKAKIGMGLFIFFRVEIHEPPVESILVFSILVRSVLGTDRFWSVDPRFQET